MMGPITKLTRQIVNANNIPSLVREAFRLAEAEKPGPVHLELPEDVSTEMIDRHPFEVTSVAPPTAPAVDINKAAEMIHNAKRPLVLIASGANRRLTHVVLQDFIDKTGLYFFNTQMGKGAIDERHPNFLGTAAISDNDYIHCAINRADLIINIGYDVSEKPPFFMEDEGAKVIHVGFFPAQIDDIYFPQHEVVGCLITSLRDLADAITPSSEWDFDYYFRVKKEIDTNVFSKSDSESFPIIPQRIVSDVREAIPSDGILSLDNGMYKIWFSRNYLAHQPNTILLDNALATMGAGLPAAIAAKMVYPDRNVVAICGDGGFMMNSQELETAIRLDLDLTVIILRDDGYGMIKWKQAGMDFPDFGLDFGNPDFVQYAQSFGAHGYRITKTGELSQVIKQSFEQSGVHVIEVPVDYSENEKVFLEELKNKTCLI
jgi:acetolactate synthase-1/2/3 large subunit